DLAEVVLLLHSLGIKRAAEFDWLDKPDRAAVERAEDLLRTLGALRSVFGVPASAGGQFKVQASANPAICPESHTEPAEAGTPNTDLTPIGRQMLRLPMHPRY